MVTMKEIEDEIDRIQRRITVFKEEIHDTTGFPGRYLKNMEDRLEELEIARFQLVLEGVIRDYDGVLRRLED